MITSSLIPSGAWYRNVRSLMEGPDWDILRRDAYRRADYKCHICGGVGRMHPVEAHEVWAYDDDAHTLHLIGVEALCPACHGVRHLGLSINKGRLGNLVVHMLKVNGWTVEQAMKHVDDSLRQWQERSRHNWKINIDWAREEIDRLKKADEEVRTKNEVEEEDGKIV